MYDVLYFQHVDAFRVEEEGQRGRKGEMREGEGGNVM